MTDTEVDSDEIEDDKEQMIIESTPASERIQESLKQLTTLKERKGTVNRSRSEIMTKLSR
jgi:hypothetical protein